MVKKAQSGRGVMDTKLSDVPKKVMNRGCSSRTNSGT